METVKKKLSALAAILLAVVTLFSAGYTIRAKAEVKSYDTSDVLEDLVGYRVDGKEFDVLSYELDPTKTEPEMITFVENRFSVNPTLKKDLGYYVYLYNPTGKAVVEDGTNVHIAFGKSIATDGYREFSLKILSKADGKLKENAFYKFKIDLSSFNSTDLYNALDKDKREYKIGEINLNLGSSSKGVEVGETYTYTGFVKGYASDGELDDSLAFSKNGIEEILHPTVTHTYYRPEGTNGKNIYTQHSLHSVYFSIANSYFEKYERLDSVQASWCAAVLNPVLVSGYTDLNTAIKPFLDKNLTTTENDKAYRANVPYVTFGNYAKKTAIVGPDNPFLYAAAYSYGHLDSAMGLTSVDVDKKVNTLYLLFEPENGFSADDYVLTGEKLKKAIDTFSEKDAQGKLYGRYSLRLFESWKEINKRIFATADYKLTDETFSKNWFSYLFNGGVVDNSFKCNAIEAVDYNTLVSDYKQGADYVAKRYCINAADVNDFVKACEENDKNEQTTYLFRYELSDYVASEASIFKKGILNVFSKVSTNAYFAQETVDLNFDIIDIGFVKDGMTYYIPCVMDPIDFFPDLTPPPYTTDDGGCRNMNWKQLFGLLALLLLLVVLLPYLPTIITFILNVITLPFKAINGLFKAARKRKKEKKHHNEK